MIRTFRVPRPGVGAGPQPYRRVDASNYDELIRFMREIALIHMHRGRCYKLISAKYPFQIDMEISAVNETTLDDVGTARALQLYGPNGEVRPDGGIIDDGNFFHDRFEAAIAAGDYEEARDMLENDLSYEGDKRILTLTCGDLSARFALAKWNFVKSLYFWAYDNGVIEPETLDLLYGPDERPVGEPGRDWLGDPLEDVLPGEFEPGDTVEASLVFLPGKKAYAESDQGWLKPMQMIWFLEQLPAEWLWSSYEDREDDEEDKYEDREDDEEDKYVEFARYQYYGSEYDPDAVEERLTEAERLERQEELGALISQRAWALEREVEALVVKDIPADSPELPSLRELAYEPSRRDLERMRQRMRPPGAPRVTMWELMGNRYLQGQDVETVLEIERQFEQIQDELLASGVVPAVQRERLRRMLTRAAESIPAAGDEVGRQRPFLPTMRERELREQLQQQEDRWDPLEDPRQTVIGQRAGRQGDRRQVPVGIARPQSAEDRRRLFLERIAERQGQSDENPEPQQKRARVGEALFKLALSKTGGDPVAARAMLMKML